MSGAEYLAASIALALSLPGLLVLAVWVMAWWTDNR